MSFGTMPLVVRVLVVAVLAEAVIWLAALALLAGGFPMLFAVGAVVGMVVVWSGWGRWEWTSDPVTIGLLVLLAACLLLFFFVSPYYLARIF